MTKAEIQAVNREQYAKHRERRLATRRAWRAANKHRVRAWNLKKYGITLDEWNSLFEQQGRKCAICESDTPRGSWWSTDHCHTTLRVRGILCNLCNVSIGQMGENPDWMRKAIRYLER